MKRLAKILKADKGKPAPAPGWRPGAVGVALVVALGACAAGRAAGGKDGSMNDGSIQIVTLDPGHFHAALIHRESYAGVDPRVHVYAPLGPDLLAHLRRVAGFNARPQDPTAWQLEIHATPDFWPRLQRERPGNVVVISGRNRGKIDYVRGAIGAGMNVLVDKPWILEVEDLDALDAALADAARRGLVARDMMTERHEITTMLQKELIADEAIFGGIDPGTPDDPGVYIESVHHLMKTVAGAPNLRPAWFFDVAQQGEGLNDVGVHLVDLVPWTLFPTQIVDRRQDVAILSAQRWPTPIPLDGFRRVTGEAGFPDFLLPAVRDGVLRYYCNTRAVYRLRGVHVKLDVLWNWEASHGDTHVAIYRGRRARVEVRQGATENYRPELYVVPIDAADAAAVRSALAARLAALAPRFPGVALEGARAELRVAVPDALRTTHEQHFGAVAREFFDDVRARRPASDWERAHMIAKYWVTTEGTRVARASTLDSAPR